MRDRFHARSPRSWVLRTHAQTAGCSLTAQQPLNNIVRVAVQALSAVLGGTQSLHTNSMDETLGLPDRAGRDDRAAHAAESSAEETGVAQTIDPLAGSYFMESLTDRIEKEAQDSSPPSIDWAESSRPSSKASRRGRSRRPRSAISSSWNGEKRPWWE
jgi:methylmalonyl-CoA mutase N-terminal domain/subunit